MRGDFLEHCVQTADLPLADLLDNRDCEKVLHSIIADKHIEKTPEVEKVLRAAYDALKAQNDLYERYGRFDGVANILVDYSTGNKVEYHLRFIKQI